MFEKMVVAIDGSESAKHALAVACDLANKYNSTLYLVHVPQLETTTVVVETSAMEIQPTPENIRLAGQQIVDQAVEYVTSQCCKLGEAVISHGDPADEILKVMENFDVHVVVMGRRGLSRIASAVLGSVSQKVAHYARGTCITVG